MEIRISKPCKKSYREKEGDDSIERNKHTYSQKNALYTSHALLRPWDTAKDREDKKRKESVFETDEGVVSGKW